MLPLFRRRRIRKRSAEFWSLLARGDVAAALEYFEENLASIGGRVSSPTRAAYHLHRWTLGRHNVHVTALELLAFGLAADDPTAQALAAVKEMQRQTALAEAIAAGRPVKWTDGNDVETDLTARVAQAFSQAQQAELAGSDEEGRRRIAERIELILMPAAQDLCDIPQREERHITYPCPSCGQHLAFSADLIGDRVTCPTCSEEVGTPDMWHPATPPPECPNEERIAAHLLVWSALVLRQYDVLCRFPELIDKALPEENVAAFLYISSLRGRAQLTAGRVEDAVLTLLGLHKLSSPTLREHLLLCWGFEAIQRGFPNSAIEWFSYHAEHPDSACPDWGALAALGLAVSYAQAGQTAKATETIGRLPEAVAAAAAGRTEGSRLSSVMTAQTYFLNAARLLATATAWEAPASAGRRSGSPGEGSTRAANNTALTGLRDQMTPLLAELANLPPEWSWWSDWFAGMLAYADRNREFPLPRVRAFGRTLGQIDCKATVGRLERMKHALLARAMAAEFWDRIRRQDTASALEYYEKEIVPVASSVDRPTRAAYHLYRWTISQNSEDIEALGLLAAGLPPDDPTARALATARNMQRQHALAVALTSSRSPSPSVVPDPQDPLPMRLALALKQMDEIQPGEDPAGGSRKAAGKVRALLAPVREQLCGVAARTGQTMVCPCPECGEDLSIPAEKLDGQVACGACAAKVDPPGMWPLVVADPPDTQERMAAHLLLWSALALGETDFPCRHPELLQAAIPDRAKQVHAAACGHRIRSSLLANDVHGAVRDYVGFSRLVTDADRTRLLLAWGLEAVEAGSPAVAIEWFSYHAEHPDRESRHVQPLAALGLTVACYRARLPEKAETALRSLPELAGSLTTEADATGSPRLRDAIASQSYFLAALALLAETADWEMPYAEEADADSPQARQVRVKNAALMAEMLPRMTPLIQALTALPPEWSWRGHLLAGMVAYVDRGEKLPLSAIRAFAQATGHVVEDQARTGLKRLEAALVSRAKATEEALRLIKRGDHGLLRQYRDTVLAVEGETIPPVLRAAVAMALWRADSSYDPLPDLEVLARQQPDSGVIERCVATVRAVQAGVALCEECTRRTPSDSLLPPLGAFQELGDVAQSQAALALACQYLRRGESQQAMEALDQCDPEGDAATVAYLRFRVAWQSEDPEACQVHGPNAAASRYMPDASSWQAALATRMLMRALQDEEAAPAMAALGKITDPPRAVVSLVARLMGTGESATAAFLLRCISTLANSKDAEACLGPNAPWTCTFLQALVSAQCGQITACTEALERLREGTVPERTVFGTEPEHQRLLDWAKLIGLEAELALSAACEDEAEGRWRTAVRSLRQGAEELRGHPLLDNYAQLILGVSAALTSRALVQRETIAGFCKARDGLNITKHTRLIDQLIDNLRRRKRVLDDFWSHIARSEFEPARLLHNEELAPAFGDRMPHSIQLAMIMVDWGASVAPMPDLLHRLAVLEHEAADLPPALLKKVKDYIVDGDNIRQLISLLTEKKFTELVDMVARTPWMGMKTGSMPLPVAVAQLYALYKTRRTGDAEKMGEKMSGATARYGAWVQDCSSLLLGYVFFEKEEYERAAEAFGRARASEVVGHDVDRYRAAAHFSRGQQLLAVDQKTQAFDEFAQALGKRTGEGWAGELAPLFIHFGVRFIEARHGNRAQQAFKLLVDGLATDASEGEVPRYRLIAEMGNLLCAVLTEEDVEELGGERFASLLGGVGKIDGDETQRPALERSLLKLAVCAELRRQTRLPQRQRKRAQWLYQFLTDQIAALYPLGSRNSAHDPVLLTLRGLVELLLNPRGESRKAIKDIEEAIKLGVQSHSLSAVLARYQEEAKKGADQHAKALDIFECYLAEGRIPAPLKARVAERRDLLELYGLSRQYLPEDIITGEVASGVENLCNRLEKLAAFAESEETGGNKELAQLGKRLLAAVERLRQMEKEALADEHETMQAVAEGLRAQSVS